MPKIAKKKPPTPRASHATPDPAVAGGAAAIEGVLDDAMSVMSSGLRSIRREMDAIERGTASDNGHDAGSRMAFLAQKAAAIAGEARKLETARQRRIDSITKAMVIAWFRQQDPVDRAQLIAEVEDMNRKRSVLS